MGTSMGVGETGRTYLLDERVELAEPAVLLGMRLLGAPEDQHLDATYFDTADLRLFRAKLILRRREGGRDEGWQMRLSAGEDSRWEVRLPLGDDRFRPPSELVALSRVHTRGAALEPVAQLVTDRTRWVLGDEAGRALVEVVQDYVSAHTLDEQAAASCREIEVGLAEYGRSELLDDIEQRLAQVGGRRASSGWELSRVLEHRLAAVRADQPNSVKPGSAAQAVLDYLRDQLGVLRAQDPLVRQDAEDAVHQMRIAARRARSTLQAFRAVLPRKATRALTDELKWLGNELAEARDSEVIQRRLSTVVHELPPELVLGPVAAQVTRALQRRRAEGQQQALAALDSDRYLALHDSFDELLTHPPLTKRAHRRADRVLLKTAGRVWRRLKKRKRRTDSAAPGNELDTALHETRKMAKRLRYVAELTEPVAGKKVAKLRRRAKAVHKVLGEHQDAVVARPQIRQLAAGTDDKDRNGFTYGLLYAAETTRAKRAEHTFPAAWHKLAKIARTI